MGKSILFLLAIFSGSLAAADGVPKDWSSRYERLVNAFTTKNIKTFQAMCSDDLMWIQVDGKKKNRKETMAEFEGMFRADKIAAHEKLLKIVRSGNTVDVHCEVFMKMDAKGKTQTVYHSFCVDSWKKIGGKWLLYKTRDTKVEVSGGQ